MPILASKTPKKPPDIFWTFLDIIISSHLALSFLDNLFISSINLDITTTISRKFSSTNPLPNRLSIPKLAKAYDTPVAKPGKTLFVKTGDN